MNKTEREELLNYLKREDFQKTKEKLLEKENLTVKNGSEPSKTTYLKSQRKQPNKTLT
jgi:hypothetical protein